MRKPVVNLAASVRARLLAYAKSRGLAFELVLTRYALERLLERLSRSPHVDRFVLKGGMLVMVWFDEPLRATRDLDLLGFGDPAPEGLRTTFAEIMAMPADDPLIFDAASLIVSQIRESGQYGGIRLKTSAALANARIPVVIDIAFGDAIEPGLLTIDYPTLLDDTPPRVRAYAPETVVAEKFQAMVSLGRANSRMKDMYDVWALFQGHDISREHLSEALIATFSRQETPLPDTVPDALTDAFATDQAKVRQWRAFAQDLTAEAPELQLVTRELAARLMPIVADARSSGDNTSSSVAAA